jgi:hypothetical protein
MELSFEVAQDMEVVRNTSLKCLNSIIVYLDSGLQ